MDLGGTAVTGMHVSTVSRLRRALLGQPGYRVKVVEPYQMLGEIDDELCGALGVDIAGVIPSQNLFGFENNNWKEMTLFDGTDVLVPGNFNIAVTENGDWFIYPQGDTSVPPSGHMPKNGFYFDSICRQGPLDEENLNVQDNLEEFGPLPQAEVDYLSARAKLLADAKKGAILSSPGTGFGDIALVPGMWLKRVRGIRDVQEWYMATAAHRDYVYEVFDKQCEIALGNLARLADAIGENVQAVFTTGTDFGMQNGLFISRKAYRDLFMPFHKRINDFIHSRTSWKVFTHTCGAVHEMIPDFIEAGFDILNPIQCSATGMAAADLKREFGKDLVFWGGAVDTQKTLPFGRPQQVYDEVRSRIAIFGKDGGFVFNAVHNIQANVPLENLLAFFKAYEDCA